MMVGRSTVGQTPENGIPPNIAPKRGKSEIRLQILDSSETLIGQLAVVTLSGAVVRSSLLHLRFSV